MGVLKRLLLIVFCLSVVLGVGFLVLLWVFPAGIEGTLIWLSSQMWVTVVELVLLGIVTAGTLVILFWAILTPAASSQLLFKDGSNEVTISKDSLASTVRHSIESHPGVTSERIRLKIKGKKQPKISVRTKVDPGRNADLVALGSAITSSITSAVETMIGYPLDGVRVSFVTSGKSTQNAMRPVPPSPESETTSEPTGEPEPQFAVSAK